MLLGRALLLMARALDSQQHLSCRPLGAAVAPSKIGSGAGREPGPGRRLEAVPSSTSRRERPLALRAAGRGLYHVTHRGWGRVRSRPRQEGAGPAGVTFLSGEETHFRFRVGGWVALLLGRLPPPSESPSQKDASLKKAFGQSVSFQCDLSSDH
ncbi:unnamed protein product [Caretta caretta]